ncbi:MAG TPA: UbiA-like polyprenyltransferase [Longimicrobiales bacterium]
MSRIGEEASAVTVPAGAARGGAAGEPREGQTFAGDSLLARYASFVKLPHTLFALPFAGVGAIVGTRVRPDAVTPGVALWIVLAFTAARFAAMGFNRIVDARYDALNPRTRQRELPTGRLSMTQAAAAVAVASVVFVAAAWWLNPLCGWLSPVALAWVFFYSYTKRFTAWSHIVLGVGLGIAPVGAYLAVTGEWSEPWWALVAFAAAVTAWAAGFDIIYAVQDEAFDREHGLHSIPARLGVRRALGVARLLHFLAVVAFFGLWWLRAFPLGWLYLAGVGVMAVLLHFAHASLRGRPAEALDFRRIDRAFFHTNVGVSTSFFVLTLLERVLLG